MNARRNAIVRQLTSNASAQENAATFDKLRLTAKQTGNIDASKLEANENTKLITPVHYSGNPVNLKEIADIAEDNDARIIEDGAHALGAKYNGKKIGSLKWF